MLRGILKLTIFVPLLACLSSREELTNRTRDHVSCPRPVQDESRDSYEKSRGWPLETAPDPFTVGDELRDEQGHPTWIARCNSGDVYRCVDQDGSVNCQRSQ